LVICMKMKFARQGIPGGGILERLAVLVLADSGVLFSGSIPLTAVDDGGGGGGDRGDTILEFSVNCTGKIRLTVIGVFCVTESAVVVVNVDEGAFEADVDELIQVDGM
jgi:hypothetical protein